MELRFQTARTTKDLDFTARTPSTGRGDVLLKQLQDAGAVDLGDFFSYRIGEATAESLSRAAGTLSRAYTGS